MDKLNEYINGLTSNKSREWMMEFITYMNTNYSEITPKISFAMPMYVLGKKMNDKGYIAFSAAKEHFTLHAHQSNIEILYQLKERLHKAKFGKGCIKVNFSNTEYIPILKETIDKIVESAK